ncbi:MAG: alpha/beta fold hydrolase [Thermoplasmatota archaeon]
MEMRDDGSGPAVVLLHGFPLDARMWRHQVPALVLAGHRVLAPDMRGDHGSIAAVAQAVAGALRERGLKQVGLVGFSMGGYVALALALSHPELVGKLVLIDTRAAGDSVEGRKKRMETLAKVESEGVEAIVKAMLPGMFTPRTWAAHRDWVDEVRAFMREQKATSVTCALKAMADRPDQTARLGQIHAPALVIVGEEDPITPPAAARALAQGLRARIEVVPQAAHLVPMEAAATCNRLLVDFFAATP